MAKVLLILVLLAVLTAVFKKVAEWFEFKKNINIILPTFIEMIAVIVFIFTYECISTSGIIWMCISIAIVVTITILNIYAHGLKDGLLASLAELVFSTSAVFLILCLLIASSQNKSSKNKK